MKSGTLPCMGIPRSLWGKFSILPGSHGKFFPQFIRISHVETFPTLKLQEKLGSIFSVSSDQVYVDGNKVYSEPSLLKADRLSWLSLSLYVYAVLQPPDQP